MTTFPEKIQIGNMLICIDIFSVLQQNINR